MGKAAAKRPAAKGRARAKGKRQRSGEPKCPQCRKAYLTQLRAERLVALWAEAEGVKWARQGQLKRWILCLGCHKKKWPEDGRNRNRWCIPKAPKAGGVHRLYVTELPPEVGPLPTLPIRPRGPRRPKPRPQPSNPARKVKKAAQQPQTPVPPPPALPPLGQVPLKSCLKVPGADLHRQRRRVTFAEEAQLLVHAPLKFSLNPDVCRELWFEHIG